MKEDEEKVQWLANVVELSDDPIITKSLDGIITTWNKGAELIYGYSAEEVIGKNISILAPSPLKNEVNQLIKKIKDGKKVFHYETIRLRKDNKQVNVSITLSPILDNSKNLIGISTIARDITLRKNYEKKLETDVKKRTAELERLNLKIQEAWEYVDNIIDTLIEPFLEKMLGYKPEEVVGKMHFYDLFVPEEREELKKEAMEAFAMKKPFNGSVNTNLHKTGSKVILETNGTPMLDKEGKLLGYRGSDTNITDRKKADEQIKLQNKTLEGINQIFKKAITVDSEDEVAKRSLEVCEEITDSKFGFILERNIHGNLDALAISNPGWDECLMEKSDAIIILKDMKERGIHGKASKDGKSFFTNDPSNQEDSIGAPEGHPDIHSFLGVPFTQRDGIIGSIGLGNKENGYDTEDLHILERLSIAISESLMRKRAENSLKIVLDEKEMLLKEIHHRVKNNLMIISSLLNLQSSYIKDKESKNIFKESQNRARSMALIHERLYQSADLKRMDFGDYIRSLSTELFNTYTANPSIIKLKINVEDILLDINTAIPLGLIVNELVTNSLKHAFPEGMRGEINVDFHPTDDHYEFTVKDNGIGFPEDLDFQNTDSLGMQIVTSLTNQIDGEIELDRNEGTKFKITFKDSELYERL